MNATKQNRQRNHVWSGAVESKSLSHWKRETKENLISGDYLDQVQVQVQVMLP